MRLRRRYVARDIVAGSVAIERAFGAEEGIGNRSETWRSMARRAFGLLGLARRLLRERLAQLRDPQLRRIQALGALLVEPQAFLV